MKRAYEHIQFPFSSVPSIEAFGHSQFTGYGTSTYVNDATATKYGFPERLGNAYGDAVVNRLGVTGGAFSGTAAQGGVGAVLQSALFATDLTGGPYSTPGGLKICGSPYNDAAAVACDPAAASYIESSVTALYSRLLAARVINPLKAGPALNTPTFTFSGAWTAFADVTMSTGLGFAFAQTNGDYVEFALDSLYNGEAITILSPAGFTSGSIATITVDGKPIGSSLDTRPMVISMFNHGAIGATLGLRVPAGRISGGAHTVRVTYTGLTGAGSTITGNFGGVIIEGNAPLVIVNVPPAPFFAGFATNANWANDRVQTVLAGFPNSLYVDLSPALLPNAGKTNVNDDLIYWNAAFPGHANNVGYGRITAEILSATHSILTPDVVGQMV